MTFGADGQSLASRRVSSRARELGVTPLTMPPTHPFCDQVCLFDLDTFSAPPLAPGGTPPSANRLVFCAPDSNGAPDYIKGVSMWRGFIASPWFGGVRVFDADKLRDACYSSGNFINSPDVGLAATLYSKQSLPGPALGRRHRPAWGIGRDDDPAPGAPGAVAGSDDPDPLHCASASNSELCCGFHPRLPVLFAGGEAGVVNVYHPQL